MDILCHMIGSSLIKSLQAITRTQFWGSSGSAYMAEFEAWNPALAPRESGSEGQERPFSKGFRPSFASQGTFWAVFHRFFMVFCMVLMCFKVF